MNMFVFLTNRRHHLRGAEQQPEQVRGDAAVGGRDVLAGQRQGAVPGLRAAEHALVLRGRHLRRQGHQAYAELRQDHLQAHKPRQATQHHHHRSECLLFLFYNILYNIFLNYFTTYGRSESF